MILGKGAMVLWIPATFSAALIIGSAACGGVGIQPVDPNSEVIARVGDREVTRSQFEGYLTTTLGGAEDVTSAGAKLKSRLLDQFLDDELLVEAATGQGLAVPDEEVRQHTPTGGGSQESVRRMLLQRKFQKEVILKDVSVETHEVRAYFEQHPAEFQRPARVVIRQILADTAQEAQSIRAEVAEHPDRFEEIAEKRSLSPDGGQPHAIEEEVLPDALRKAIASLKEGELSEVVEDPQGFFLLKLEERQAAQAPNLEEARERIELKLLQEKSQRRYDEFITSLRDRTKLEILEEKLGFPYTGKNRS